MTTLSSIENAADRAAVIEQNFQLLDAALFGTNSNFRVKLKGDPAKYQAQLYDAVTELWYDVSIVTVDTIRSVALGDAGES